MPKGKVEPHGSSSESSDHESEGESGAEDDPKAPKPKYNDIEKAKGYEDLGFDAKVKVKPPKAKELEGEKPEMPFSEISEIVGDECREALIQFVSEHCCYGSKPAKEMEFKEIKPMTAYHYILETYGEKRSTQYESVPYRGEVVDGPENGPPPGPWDMQCTCQAYFKDEVYRLEVPHTSVVRPCQRCGADGQIKCIRCRGRGRLRCGACHGRGRKRVRTENGTRRVVCTLCWGSGKRTCHHCGGSGQITCPKCKGCCQLRIYIELKVKFKNHKSDYIHETTDLPDQLIAKVKGNIVFKQELDLVWPLTSYPVMEINNQSHSLIKKHISDYSTERLLQQRQTLRAVPVTEVDGKYDDEKKTFWVYGMEKKVHFPDYPQKCCWGCQIL